MKAKQLNSFEKARKASRLKCYATEMTRKSVLYYLYIVSERER